MRLETKFEILPMQTDGFLQPKSTRRLIENSNVKNIFNRRDHGFDPVFWKWQKPTEIDFRSFIWEIPILRPYNMW
jgi:hypothetical protein